MVTKTRACEPAAGSPAAGGEARAGTDAMPPRAARGVSPPRVRRPAAARRIRAAADAAATLPARDQLRRLTDLVRGGAGDAQRAEFIEAAIAACIDDAAAFAAGDRWLACEAATWALAWMARARRAGGSAGGLLERLVAEARRAVPLLAEGDTLPARFVLTLARLFRDIEACGRLETAATAAIAAEIDRLATPRGSVSVAGSAAMVERVVRWTAFRETGLATGAPAWGEAAEGRWREAATATLRLLGGRGRRIVGGGLMPSRCTAGLLEAVAELGGRERRTVEVMQRGRGSGRLLRRDRLDADAAMAVMRSGWRGDDVRVLIDFRRAVPHLEIAVADRLLVDGPWEWSLSLGNTVLEAEGPWMVECWESDHRASFLELAAPLPGGRRFERHVALLPEERVVLLADAVTAESQPEADAPPPSANGHAQPGPLLQYSSAVRLAPGLEAEPAEETREVLLFDARIRLLAMPLALPEWRTGRGGRFAADAAGLRLAQETAGPRLYAPVWLDCEPGRIGRPLTWRQLTVADTRVNLPPWQAAGFRVQVGLDQWLLYRTLDAPRNRTLLGCNVSCDFLIGRLKPRGEVRRLLEIQ